MNEVYLEDDVPMEEKPKSPRSYRNKLPRRARNMRRVKTCFSIHD